MNENYLIMLISLSLMGAVIAKYYEIKVSKSENNNQRHKKYR